MPTPPLRLRLTGAHILRDRKMIARTVALEGGRIAAGPFPAVDLNGYLVLPGIIDPLSRLSGGEGAKDIADIAQRLACSGVTTAWLGHHAHAPGALSPALPAIAGPDRDAMAGYETGGLSCDLRPALICDRLLAQSYDDIIARTRRHGVSLVLFDDDYTRRLAQSETDPEGFANWARAKHSAPAALLAQLRRAYDARAQIPRALCRLADAFDADGILYGSLSDSDGETRETWQMLGARLCFSPRADAAAAIAQAVGSPVIAAASDLMDERTAAARPVRRLIRKRHCQALSSGAVPGALIRAAFTLADGGTLDLPEAWRLISEEPAAIMGLPDRGLIAPGKRADLVVVHAATRRVEATICGGRITHLTGGAAARFMKSEPGLRMAAE